MVQLDRDVTNQMKDMRHKACTTSPHDIINNKNAEERVSTLKDSLVSWQEAVRQVWLDPPSVELHSLLFLAIWFAQISVPLLSLAAGDRLDHRLPVDRGREPRAAGASQPQPHGGGHGPTLPRRQGDIAIELTKPLSSQRELCNFQASHA